MKPSCNVNDSLATRALSEAETALLAVARRNPGIRTAVAARDAELQFKNAAGCAFRLRQLGLLRPSDPACYGELWPTSEVTHDRT